MNFKHFLKKSNKISVIAIIIVIFSIGCNKSSNQENMETKTNVLFLHHSTGNNIWRGGEPSIINRVLRKLKLNPKSKVEKWFIDFNSKNGTNYSIKEQAFPKKEPYGWKNYPYDYYNIWVKNGGNEPFMEEPTLEMLTKENDLIIWKHCFPVGSILESEAPDINSETKTLENYKLQYAALKTKMKEFPETKFLVWTGAALVEAATNEEQAKRARAFRDWVVNEWDEPGDNIFLWDFYELETEGGIYLAPNNAASPTDSHPSPAFSKEVYPYFCQRIVDVIENKGDSTDMTGKK